jgi:tyrosinase
MMRYTRRKFLTSTLTALGAATLPWAPGQAFAAKGTAGKSTARYRRYSVSSPEGQRMLASYARAVQAMINLPATHPLNWFRISFIHLMDCPHGNWWFYVWHRGYVGYIERAIRQFSGDPGFTMPFWDWTEQPQIPAGMFDGALNPTAAAYEPYTGNLAKFTAFMQPALKQYWGTLSAQQLAQLKARGYPTFDTLWNGVTGYDPEQDAGISGNMAFAITCGARYLSRAQPKLDDKTAYAVSPVVVTSGLAPKTYYDGTNIAHSFTSSKTTSHVDQPDGATRFSILEGQPHNLVHNCIGGVGAVDPGPYGNMTNFLSPVDPIFFLHHANMDRLWDVWTHRQIAAGLPYAPTGDDLALFANEPFLFYVGGDGRPVGPTRAGQYFSTSTFDYDYAPGFGSHLALPSSRALAVGRISRIKATVSASTATLALSNDLIRRHVTGQLSQPLVAEITLPRPSGLSTTREYDVLINAPAGVTHVDVGSPYYAGTVAFFGPSMPGMHMSHDATFAVPLPTRLGAFSRLGLQNTTLQIRVVPTHERAAHAPVLSAATILGG